MLELGYLLVFTMHYLTDHILLSVKFFFHFADCTFLVVKVGGALF